jgi:UPF0755 protein
MSEPASPSAPVKGKSSLGLWLLATAVMVFLAAAAIFVAMLLPAPRQDKATLIFHNNLGLQAMGEMLAENGIIPYALLFTLPAKLSGSGAIKTGEYEFTPHMTPLDVLELLRSGRTVIHKLTVPEGLTNADVLRLLEAETALTGEVGDVLLEGRLYPATYNFSHGDARREILQEMQGLARTILMEEWGKRLPDLPLASPEEALTLASIVEKETGQADERRRVAGVFINRLRLGMRLQSDPTVIYAATGGKSGLKRALTNADLDRPSPYNTYVVNGLPPSPIANPGRASLQAVLNPEKHDYLYFVADGSGGHAFATTLAEHNRNVAAWRRLGKE